MVPWKLLDKAAVPGGGGEITLHSRGDEFSIRVNGVELMNSRSHGSEEALARLAAPGIAGRPAPRILVGGLGMGFTLAAALALLPPEGRATVAEICPEVVAWNRGPLAHLAGRPLEDPRAEARVEDVATAMAQGAGSYHAILLDVDNGPDGLTLKANDYLYGRGGIAAAFSALAPGGVLAVWSAAPDPAFARRLSQGGFSLREIRLRARGQKGGRHVIWAATRGA